MHLETESVIHDKSNEGPPKVHQGKASNGQPKKPFGLHGPKIRNLILIIPDGFGPASEVFARGRKTTDVCNEMRLIYSRRLVPVGESCQRLEFAARIRHSQDWYSPNSFIR